MESAPCEMCKWNTRFALTYVHSGRKSLPDGERGAGLTASQGARGRPHGEPGGERKSLPDGELNPGLDGDSVGY